MFSSTASSCHFDNAVCLARNQSQFLRKAYSGPCINMSTPCNVVLQQRCHHTYSRSLYVCGTDGRTYSKYNTYSEPCINMPTSSTGALLPIYVCFTFVEQIQGYTVSTQLIMEHSSICLLNVALFFKRRDAIIHTHVRSTFMEQLEGHTVSTNLIVDRVSICLLHVALFFNRDVIILTHVCSTFIEQMEGYTVSTQRILDTASICLFHVALFYNRDVFILTHVRSTCMARWKGIQ